MSGSSKRGKKNKPLHFLAEYLSSSCLLVHIKTLEGRVYQEIDSLLIT